MKDEFRQKLIAYRTAMSVVKSMLNSGVITHKEYEEFEKKLALKYGISEKTIFK